MKNRYFLIGIFLSVATLAAGLIVFPHLPQQVPSRWDIHGNVTRFFPRALIVFLIPAMMVGQLLLFAFLPVISPRRFEIDSFRSTCLYILMSGLIGLAYFQGLWLWVGVSPGFSISINKAFIAGISVLFVLTGNVFGKVKRNFFLGVRTPWTLANEQVWYATHRVAAKTLVAAGLTGLALVLTAPVIMALALLIAGALFPIVYSFIYYKRLERQSLVGS